MLKAPGEYRLLFVDSQTKWLAFVMSTLANLFHVRTTARFDFLVQAQEEARDYDLVFLGLGLARENMEALRSLIESTRWAFVVFTPGYPEKSTARALYKLGVRDVIAKPYDQQSLTNVIRDEIEHAEDRIARRGAFRENDYQSRVVRLEEIFQITASPSGNPLKLGHEVAGCCS
jgi:DNA-binding NtrC family response regulator